MLMRAFPVWILMVVAVTPASTFAQRTPPPPSRRFDPNPVVTRPGSIQDAGLYGYWTGISEQDRVGGALLGKVVIKDEVLPWDPISVTVTCNGSTAYTTDTDSRGVFAVLPSRIPGELSLQGDRERQMQVHFEGCILEAVLTGFRSTSITITEHQLRDNPEVGAITLTRESNPRGTAISVTSKSVPDDAAKFWSKAGEEMLAGHADRAREQLQNAVRVYPGFAEAWYRLGELQIVSNPRDAEMCLQKAVSADSNFASPYQQLAGLSVQQGDWWGALKNSDRYLKLNPKGNARVWYYNALSNFQLGNTAGAESSANKLLAMDPLHNVRNGEQLLAAALARKADYAGALTHLRNCLTYVHDRADVSLIKQQIAILEQDVAKAKSHK